MQEIILETQGLHYKYGDGPDVLNNISLQFHTGKKYALVGHNGAGKTTLLLHLNGIIKPNAGCILFHGKDIKYSRNDLITLRSGVGVVFQDANTQLFSANVYEELSFGPKNLGLSDEEIRNRVDEIIRKLGIHELKNRPTHFLSVGEKKKVAIASVLTMLPKVVVLDEPFANLDHEGAEQLMVILETLNKAGKTIIVSTHDINSIYPWADYIYLMDQGAIVHEGMPAKVFSNGSMLRRTNLKKPWIVEVYDAILQQRPALKEESPIPRNKQELLDLITESIY